jgi:hypothetical protein
MTSNEEDKNILLLNEIEKVYERELERKKTLESKATNVITVSGIMVTLLFGFSAFLFKRVSIRCSFSTYQYSQVSCLQLSPYGFLYIH